MIVRNNFIKLFLSIFLCDQTFAADARPEIARLPQQEVGENNIQPDALALITLSRIVALEKGGHVAQAVELLRNARGSAYLNGMYYLAVASESLGQPEKATHWFRRWLKLAVELFGEDQDAVENFFRGQGKLREASNIGFRVADEVRGDKVLFDMAKRCLSTISELLGPAHKIELHEECLRKGWTKVRLPLADLHFSHGDRKRALQLFSELDPTEIEGDAAVMTNYGILLAEQGRIKKARAWFKKAIAKGSAEAMNNYGTIFFKQGHFDKAEQAYRQAMKTNPSPLMQYNLAITLRSQKPAGDQKEIINLLRSAEAGGIDVAVLRLAIELPVEDAAEKETLFLRAIEAGEKDALVFYADFLNKQGRFEAAQEWAQFDRLMEEVPQIPTQGPEPLAHRDDDEKDSEIDFGTEPRALLGAVGADEDPALADNLAGANDSKDNEPENNKPVLAWLETARARLNDPSPVLASSKEALKRKTYKDVTVLANKGALSEILVHESKIKMLISCLANGEPRGHLEPLHTQNISRVYSMHLTGGVRIVFSFEGSMHKGITGMRIYLAKGHYDSLGKRLKQKNVVPVAWSRD